MKKILLLALISIISIGLSSCEDNGTASQSLNGYESALPPELKGLKVYRVKVGPLDYIKVAVINNKIVGTNYSEGKTTENVAIIDNSTDNQRTIIVEEIISENDSIIVIKKKIE